MKLIDKFNEHFFTPETKLYRKLLNIPLGAALYIMWIEFMFWLYSTYIPEFYDLGDGPDPQYSLIYTFLGSSILTPFVEEFLYRTPLSVVRHIPIKGIMLYTVLYSSILFGLIHWGENWTVPWQGVAGIIFCYVYIKNGYSFISSLTMHFLINFYYSFINL